MEERLTSKRCIWATISVESDACFVLAQGLFAPDDTGSMRIAASVGTGPLRVKFMKPGETERK